MDIPYDKTFIGLLHSDSFLFFVTLHLAQSQVCTLAQLGVSLCIQVFITRKLTLPHLCQSTNQLSFFDSHGREKEKLRKTRFILILRVWSPLIWLILSISTWWRTSVEIVAKFSVRLHSRKLLPKKKYRASSLICFGKIETKLRVWSTPINFVKSLNLLPDAFHKVGLGGQPKCP